MSAFDTPQSWSFGLLLLAMHTACSSGPASDVADNDPVCAPSAVVECPDPAPRYDDVAPIFERRCASCHSGVVDGPWPLDTYDHVADWAPVVRDELLRCSMPPADARVGMRPEERDEILAWVRCGFRK
jgi:uncharacterized membrane protein